MKMTRSMFLLTTAVLAAPLAHGAGPGYYGQPAPYGTPPGASGMPGYGPPPGYGFPGRPPAYGAAPAYGAPAAAPARPMPEPAAVAPAAGPADTVAVSISGMRYGPAEVRIAAGGSVTWTNNDGMPHTVTANDRGFDSGALRRGQSFSRTFSEPGTYAYYCAYHPGMVGTVVVE